MTLVIAHRGASHDRPENTVAAFEHARAVGADGVELDVRRTGDDHLVVHHDPLLPDGRTICETPRGELPADLPSLTAALDACAGMFVNVEIKNDPDEPDHDPSDWVAQRVAAELERRGAATRWLVSSFRRETVATMREILPAVRTAWLVVRPTAETITAVVDGGHTALHPYDPHVSAASIAEAHAHGVAVNVWTCDDPDRMRELMAWGVDGICTNRPDVAVAVRSR